MSNNDLLYGDPTTAGPNVAYNAVGKPFGAGKTAHQQGAFSPGTSSNDRANAILQEIQKSAGQGTFNEGQMTTALASMKQLQSELQSGKLSQGDYISIAGQFLPQIIAYGNQMAQTGSAGARSVVPILTQLDDLNQDVNIYKSGQQFFGRDLTAGEVAQIKPAFQGPNGSINGQAFLANLAQQYKSNPSMDPGKAIKTGDAQVSVAQQFKSVLGRDATQDELAHFTQAIQSGQTDAYGLGSFLKQMPEYTNAQDATFRSGLNTELQNYDTQEFGREKGDIMADYQRRGMGASPSLDYALTDLMGKIASNRSAYLSTLSASQYGGNKDLAVGNYQNSLSQMRGQNQQNQQNQQNMGNALMSRGFEGADYQTQMNDYMRYLDQSKGKKYNPLYGAAGGLIGAGIGSFGGPGGTAAGYQIGAGFGNGYGYLNS